MKKILIRLITMFFVLVMVMGGAGCSALVPWNQSLTVVVSEPDAQIYVNGARVGEGSVVTRVRRDQNVAIMATKKGYTPATREIGTTLSMIGIVDILAGTVILVPFAGLLFPGARELLVNNVALTMHPESQ